MDRKHEKALARSMHQTMAYLHFHLHIIISTIQLNATILTSYFLSACPGFIIMYILQKHSYIPLVQDAMRKYLSSVLQGKAAPYFTYLSAIKNMQHLTGRLTV